MVWFNNRVVLKKGIIAFLSVAHLLVKGGCFTKYSSLHTTFVGTRPHQNNAVNLSCKKIDNGHNLIEV